MKIKTIKVLTFFFISLLILYSCDSSTNPPPEEKPSGYQEDVPWPSLADSPWPRYHGNAQNTGRTKFIGPQSGAIIRTIDIDRISYGIVIGSDSNFYFTSSYPGYLYSMTKQGNLNWKIKLTEDEILSTPLIDNNGTIYVGLFQDGKFEAINANGTKKWEYTCSGIVQRGFNIDLDGALYFIDINEKKLCAVKNNGELLWSLYDVDFASSGAGVSAFSASGDILYLTSNNMPIIAVDVRQRTILWKFGFDSSSLLIDSDGFIYSISRKIDSDQSPKYLFKITADANIVWQNELTGWIDYGPQDPAIDKNGNIYIASDSLYSFNNYGKLRWKIGFDAEHEISRHAVLCDGNSNIYIATEAGAKKYIYSYNDNGDKIWSLQLNSDGIFIGSGAIGYDNILYIATDFGGSKIFVIK